MKRKQRRLFIKIYLKHKRLCFLKIEVSVSMYEKIITDIQNQLVNNQFIEVANMLINKEEIRYVRY